MKWVDIYRHRTTTAAEAVKDIRSGDRVWVHPGCNTPVQLINAMVDRAPELENVEVVHILTLAPAPYVEPGMEPHFRHRALFTGGNVRQAVNDGRADFVPIHLHEVPSADHRWVDAGRYRPGPPVASG